MSLSQMTITKLNLGTFFNMTKYSERPANTLTTNELAQRWGFNPRSLVNARHLQLTHPKYIRRGRNIFYKLSAIIEFEKKYKIYVSQ